MTKKFRTAMDAATGKLQHETERITAELDFARDLCDLNPEKAGEWRPLVDQAEAAVQTALATTDLSVVREAVKAAEASLAPVAREAKRYTIHCVGHAHIDMNWMWSWPETVAVTTNTLRTVLKFMEEYPDFCFSQSQASIYAILEKYRPDLLKKVAKYVKEGRWEVTASHWVEGDKNLAGAESLCRHVLYTRRYMKKLFKLSPADVPIDWSPDTFGHPATVPTYLSRAGVKFLYLHRPGTDTQPAPWLFWWEGPDGSRVLVRNDSRVGYNGQIHPGMIREMISYAKETKSKDYMFVYGVGDHGGGPTRRDIELAMDMNTWPVFPAVRFSTAKTYFDIVSRRGAELPVKRGELNFECQGCYTTQTLIKKANRFGENRLVDAETAAAIVSTAGLGNYPTDHFEEGWRNVLFNQFHDILPGSGVRDTRTYTHGLFQQTMALTAQAESHALQILAGDINTSNLGSAKTTDVPASRLRSGVGAGVGFGTADGGLSRADASDGHGNRPFVIFNPTPNDRQEVIEIQVWDNGPKGTTPMQKRSYQVRLPDGKIIPAQVIAKPYDHYWGHGVATLAIPVKVPGLGYAVYTVIEDGDAPATENPAELNAKSTGETHHCGYMFVERASEGLENEFLKVEIDPATGGIQRLVNKTDGVELVTPKQPAPVLEYEVERPHVMTAWLIQHRGAPAEYPQLKNIKRNAGGPYLARIEAEFVIHESTFTVSYELRSGDPKLYVHINGTWFQRGTPETGVPALNFVMPLALEKAQGCYEIPFGAIERNLNHREEVPSQQWARITGTAKNAAAGCLLLNDCKYGHSLEGNTLRLTLIRSSYDPDILPEICQHEIHLAIKPFAGELPVADAIREGQAFNHAIRAIGTSVHEGRLPLEKQFVKLHSDAAILSAVKKTEDGNRMLLRLFNPTGKRVTAKLDFAGSPVFPAVKSASELDLLERPAKTNSARVKKQSVTVVIPPKGLTTLAVGFGK